MNCWTCTTKVFCACPANLCSQDGIIPNALFTSAVLLFIWIIPKISASSECVSCALWYNNPESPQRSDTNVLTLQYRIPQGPSVAWIWVVAELHSNPWTNFLISQLSCSHVCAPLEKQVCIMISSSFSMPQTSFYSHTFFFVCYSLYIRSNSWCISD